EREADRERHADGGEQALHRALHSSICPSSLASSASLASCNSRDYLSTVSGGGYIGSCLSATMTYLRDERDDFVLSKPDAVAQIRDRSNYLLPRGRAHFGQAVAIII